MRLLKLAVAFAAWLAVGCGAAPETAPVGEQVQAVTARNFSVVCINSNIPSSERLGVIEGMNVWNAIGGNTPAFTQTHVSAGTVNDLAACNTIHNGLYVMYGTPPSGTLVADIETLGANTTIVINRARMLQRVTDLQHSPSGPTSFGREMKATVATLIGQLKGLPRPGTFNGFNLGATMPVMWNNLTTDFSFNILSATTVGPICAEYDDRITFCNIYNCDPFNGTTVPLGCVGL